MVRREPTQKESVVTTTKEMLKVANTTESISLTIILSVVDSVIQEADLEDVVEVNSVVVIRIFKMLVDIILVALVMPIPME